MDCTVVVLFLTVTLSQSTAESTEEEQPYSHSYGMSTVNLQDILQTSSVNKFAIRDEKSSPSDEDSHLTDIPTQYVEDHPRVLRISQNTPPPSITPTTAYIKNTGTEELITTTNVYTDEPEEPMKVIPIRERDQRKGVLDLLFPPSRVRAFKDVFDSVRRLLSYTFR